MKNIITILIVLCIGTLLLVYLFFGLPSHKIVSYVDEAVVVSHVTHQGLPIPSNPLVSPLTLSQILCQLDARACKMKLQYSIDQQYTENQGKHWIGWAWPKDLSWSNAENKVPMYADCEGRSTKDEVAKALLELLSDGHPNFLPPAPEKPKPSEPQLEPSVTGPKNCDSHKTCQ
jgi:hypothetical protein